MNDAALVCEANTHETPQNFQDSKKMDAEGENRRRS